MKKRIAWGASKLLHVHLSTTPDHGFSYCVDSKAGGGRIVDLDIRDAEALLQEKPGDYQVVVFAVANTSLREIGNILGGMGLIYGKDYLYYSDLMLESFSCRFRSLFRRDPAPEAYRYALTCNLNSAKPMQTTVLGTLTFLECLRDALSLGGCLAEVGCYEGGNAMCALDWLAAREVTPPPYYLFDSFEGFPETSPFDPETATKGQLRTTLSANQIRNHFLTFPNARVIRGFVPGTFSEVPDDAAFSLVFYDCDLYQPALDTLAFFWERMSPGAWLVAHDYEVEPGGYQGVKKAVDEFFASRDVVVHPFPENTMALVRKPGTAVRDE